MLTTAGRARSKAMRALGVLILVLAPGTMLLGAGPALADPPMHELECDPIIERKPPETVDDTDTSRIEYRGFWKTEKPMRGQYMGTQHITNVGGSTASFAMPWAPWSFVFGYTKMRNAGKAALYYNNQWFKTIDMYAPTTQYNCAVVFWHWGAGPGTFTVKALNQKRPESGGTYVNVDYFHYET